MKPSVTNGFGSCLGTIPVPTNEHWTSKTDFANFTVGLFGIVGVNDLDLHDRNNATGA